MVALDDWIFKRVCVTCETKESKCHHHPLFLHREALIGKTIGVELKMALDQAVKMVNFVRQRPLKSHIFAKLCKSMHSAHMNLIQHTDVRWLSRGNVLSRVYELRE